jgi:hypothetical protein
MKKSHNRKTTSGEATPARGDADMPKEIDFSGGTRGKFHRPSIRLRLPVYLDADVQAYLTAIAARKGIPLSELTSDLLKKEIAIIETVSASGAAAVD